MYQMCRAHHRRVRMTQCAARHAVWIFGSCAAPAHAHSAPEGHGVLALLMHWDPLGLVLLATLGIIYLAGQLRLGGRLGGERPVTRGAVWFWSGWAALGIALSPLIEAYTGASFAVHMVQHEMLMLVAAPLLVLSRPQGVLIWGLPGALRGGAAGLTGARVLRHFAAAAVTPFAAWTIHAVALWGWHVPAAFQSTLTSEPLHWLQHITFFVAAVVFWHSVLTPGARSERSGLAFLSIFTTAMHTGVLGALLTFSSTQWYPAYTGFGGLTALEDQQLGGLIMWVPGGMAFLIGGLAIGARWLVADGERKPAAP